MLKKPPLPIFISIASLLMPVLVEATDWVISPQIETGIMDYKYEQWHPKYTFSLTDKLPFLGVGATLAYDRFFIEGYQKTGQGKEPFLDRSYYFGQAVEELNADFNFRLYSLTVGYWLSDKFSMYGGYQARNTSFNLSNTSHDRRFEIDYEASGPFVGLAYGWRIGSGLLSLNSGYASLNIENETSINNGSVEPITFSNRTLAQNIGISWNAPITRNLSYGVSLSSYSLIVDELAESRSDLRLTLTYSFDVPKSSQPEIYPPKRKQKKPIQEVVVPPNAPGF
ncbi:MAG: hypothetical protein B6247_27680 [Candidatus Parabeggiatoa sp. nov. 2]|nr:MAG: hypothetical protein B6247_27680 [Beggiatoa sp. 4572_84]